MVAERTQRIIDQAAEERSVLVDWVRGVPGEAWPHLSPDGSWQARDYVAHLAAIDPLLTAWFRSLQRPPRAAGATTASFSIDDWNEEQILARRSQPIDALLEEMAAHRIEMNATLAGLTDEHLDQVIHFGGDNKRSPRDLALHQFLSAWVLHDRWHMEDARRAIAAEPEQPFGDESFEQAMQAGGSGTAR